MSAAAAIVTLSAEEPPLTHRIVGNSSSLGTATGLLLLFLFSLSLLAPSSIEIFFEFWPLASIFLMGAKTLHATNI